uniref:Uncharacterized protein n=1 Tax=Anguilla anguilla TaxID=7936 RepID=A0A0E9URZ8_ANGAN
MVLEKTGLLQCFLKVT